ncbi:MAG: electron transfer flavoprotein subunit alpha/FixB family protein [Candidatus Abyssobacteria bacterium SURF_17]|uniref:Electron transfer flavoprotein subunit alpha n=1 Tax=Candidatus Abyssobacteria bacterium SURF_17 TaxID=2093361 RepID=A0A419EQF0_9BACT|nr:MAG: electron transfer flavoprotein subunit alpha/FixB family protein [Candidatus Abyssubacteria bacterium SURF_17]
MSGVWVFAETRDGKIIKVVNEMLNASKGIAAKLGEDTAAVLLGSGVEPLAKDLAAMGAKKVYLADDAKLARYAPGAYAKIVADLVKKNQPSVMLFGNSAVGKDLGPTVAARLGVGMCSDCTGLEVNAEKKVVFTRPVYAAKAMTTVVCKDNPQMATIRPNVLPPGEPAAGAAADVEKVSAALEDADLRTVVKDVVMSAAGKIELTEANVIVSGGRGMKGPEHFKLLEDLANVLGAAVGASRAAVDAGWRDHHDQVGQTGKVVNPSLYIACGISGSIQHLAGMKTSKVIVAVNKDPEAPIFKVANYGIVGDLFKVVPVMTEEFKKLLAQ